jgi:hypothetical protein
VARHRWDCHLRGVVGLREVARRLTDHFEQSQPPSAARRFSKARNQVPLHSWPVIAIPTIAGSPCAEGSLLSRGRC